MNQSLQPKKRSKVRIIAGQFVYRLVRHVRWKVTSKKFACRKANPKEFQYGITQHQTPLLRNLSSAEMWLQQNKVTNLKLAVSRLNGITIRSGEVFSFWWLVGKPTRPKGYKKGMVLFNGTIRPGVGGGLCQLSNLIYWMTLHTPLTVIERWRHSYDVFPDVNRNQPFGSGATVAYNHIDLQIQNNTDQDFILHLYLTEDHLVGEWRSNKSIANLYRVYERDHCITHEPWGGYVRQNKVFREIYDRHGNLVADELIAENHAVMMYQPFLSGGNEPSPSKSEMSRF